MAMTPWRVEQSSIHPENGARRGRRAREDSRDAESKGNTYKAPRRLKDDVLNLPTPHLRARSQLLSKLFANWISNGWGLVYKSAYVLRRHRPPRRRRRRRWMLLWPYYFLPRGQCVFGPSVFLTVCLSFVGLTRRVASLPGNCFRLDFTQRNDQSWKFLSCKIRQRGVLLVVESKFCEDSNMDL